MQVFNDPRMFNLAAATVSLRAFFSNREKVINVTRKQPTKDSGGWHRLRRSKQEQYWICSYLVPIGPWAYFFTGVRPPTMTDTHLHQPINPIASQRAHICS